jgi:hypothetical protein
VWKSGLPATFGLELVRAGCRWANPSRSSNRYSSISVLEAHAYSGRGGYLKDNLVFFFLVEERKRMITLLLCLSRYSR